MKEIFNTDIVNSFTRFTISHTISILLCNKIKQIYNQYGFSIVITSAKIASCLQDNSLFNIHSISQQPLYKINDDIYSVGTINGIQINVDPLMNWDDNRVIFSNDIKKCRKIKLNKIFNNNTHMLHEYILIIEDKMNYLI